MVYNVSVKKTKFTVKDCTPKMRKNQLFLPINLEKVIEVDASVRMLDEICSELYYTNLDKAYGRKVLKGAATPAVMFEILVYGYMKQRYGSVELCILHN